MVISCICPLPSTIHFMGPIAISFKNDKKLLPTHIQWLETTYQLLQNSRKFNRCFGIPDQFGFKKLLNTQSSAFSLITNTYKSVGGCFVIYHNCELSDTCQKIRIIAC